MPVPICLARKENGFVAYVNPAFCRLVNLPLEKITGKDSVSLGFFKSQEHRKQILSETEFKGISWSTTFSNSKGESFELTISSCEIQIDGVSYILSTLVDISASIKSEKDISKKLQLENEILFSELGPMAKIGGWQINVEDMSSTWTDEVARIYDLEPGTSINIDKGIEYYHENSRQSIIDAVNGAIYQQMPMDLELQLVSAKGVNKWIRTIGKPIVENGKTIRVIGLFQDITEKKMAEEVLIKSENRFRVLIENSGDVVLLSDEKRKIKYISPSVKNVLGYTQEEVAGKFTHEFMHPDDLPEILNQVSKMLEKPGNIVQGIQCRLRHKKGHWVWVEGIGSNLLHEPSVKAVITNFQDISARKQFEERLNKYTQELEASNKELERFAYVTSHDLQEPLRMVSSFLQLLEKKYDNQLDDAARQYIRYAVEGSERMKLLITDLLNYSRVGTDKEKAVLVNVNQMIKNLCDNVFVAKIKSLNAQIITEEMPEMMGFKTQLQQLFQNLVSNALKYKSKRDPVIRISCEDKGTHWQLAVEDNGIGIDENFYDKVFVIFQRLHGRNEFSGTGIGLAICKKIVEKHKGKIWVTSETGKGSIFYFTIAKIL